MSDLCPTPWKVHNWGDACSVHDVNGDLVETVYGRDGDPSGEQIARRIVQAVNGMAVLIAEDPTWAEWPGEVEVDD